MNKYGLLLLVILFNTSANLLLKKGSSSINFPSSFTSTEITSLLFQAVTNVFIVSGLIIFATGFFLWVLVLNKIQVSIAVPMMSMSYILITLVAFFFLSEPITITKAIGITLIILGVFFISR